MKIIAFRIWMIAVILNTFAGTALLTHFFSDKDEIAIFIFFGFVFATIASLPFFLILLFIMNRSISKNDAGKIIFRKTLLSGIILASTAILAFFYFFGNSWGNENVGIFFCVLSSAAIAICTQRKSLMRLCQPIEFDSI